MNFNNNLKNILHEEYSSINVPEHLKYKVLARIRTNKTAPRVSFAKKAILICLVLFLLTPAFGYSLIADQVYGSFGTAQQYGITQSEYVQFDGKLNEASKILSPQEFVEFVGLAKDLIFFMIKHGDMSTTERDKLGQVDVAKLTPDQQEEYNQLVAKIQPYFDKLNK